MSKLPAFQFYPADWRKDPGIQALSFHDRGVWFEILCLMHESEQRGKLLLNGKPMPEDALARLLGLDKQNLTKTLTILIEYGVATRDEDGALMNRRMVRDENLRKIRQEAGKLGGNPNLVKQKSSKSKKEVNQKATPSSSSSTSVSYESKDSADKSPDVIWGLGVQMLVRSGMEQDKARSFLGGLAKQHGKTQLATAIAQTSAANPANPKEYLAKVVQDNKPNGAARPNGAAPSGMVY